MTKMTFNEIINCTEHFTAQHAKYRILYCIHHLYIQKKNIQYISCILYPEFRLVQSNNYRTTQLSLYQKDKTILEFNSGFGMSVAYQFIKNPFDQKMMQLHEKLTVSNGDNNNNNDRLTAFDPGQPG